METEKGRRIEQILATDVTREQLAEALWCAEDSQRMWHGCAEENRSFRLKAEAENVKLRELCRRFSEYVSHDRCEGCVVKRRCNDGEVDECWQMGEIRKLARELRVEVEG